MLLKPESTCICSLIPGRRTRPCTGIADDPRRVAWGLDPVCGSATKCSGSVIRIARRRAAAPSQMRPSSAIRCHLASDADRLTAGAVESKVQKVTVDTRQHLAPCVRIGPITKLDELTASARAICAMRRRRARVSARRLGRGARRTMAGRRGAERDQRPRPRVSSAASTNGAPGSGRFRRRRYRAANVSVKVPDRSVRRAEAARLTPAAGLLPESTRLSPSRLRLGRPTGRVIPTIGESRPEPTHRSARARNGSRPCRKTRPASGAAASPTIAPPGPRATPCNQSSAWPLKCSVNPTWLGRSRPYGSRTYSTTALGRE